MKRWRIAMMALALAGILTGCKSKIKETEAPTEPPTEAMTTEAPTEMTEPVTEAPPEPEDSMNKTRVLKGLVKSSDASTLKIQTERGKELQFNITGADIQLASGLQAGATVNVLYKGKVADTDTSGAKVQIIRELEAGGTPVTEGEQMTEAEEADPNAGAGTLTGSIADINADRIVVLADDGDSYYFSLYETDINLKNGFQEDNYVTVAYVGDIYGPDIVPASSVTDTENAQDKVPFGPSAGGDFDYVSGTIDECTTSTLTITSDGGDQLVFNTVGATQCFPEGMATGSYITVQYSGDLEGDASSVKVSAVYNYTENTGNTENAAQTEAGDDAGDQTQNGAEQPDEDGGDDVILDNSDDAAAA